MFFGKSWKANISSPEQTGYQNNSVPTGTREIYLVRLDEAAYKELLKAIGGAALPAVTSHTTELQAGEQIGIQRVLRALREGFVAARG